MYCPASHPAVNRHDGPVVVIPESTKVSLQQRLTQHAQARWPGLPGVEVRYRAGFAYVDAELSDGDRIPLMRLRYQRSAHLWGFAIYLASKDGYQDSVLPDGQPVGTAEDALDCAAGLYLTDLNP
jgi:hypothetical protein